MALKVENKAKMFCDSRNNNEVASILIIIVYYKIHTKL